jgi:hypothetical protein
VHQICTTKLRVAQSLLTVIKNCPILFEGGPLDGNAYELPPGTTEISIIGTDLMPGTNRYQLVVSDSGISAVWVGFVSTNAEAPNASNVILLPLQDDARRSQAS